MPVMPILDQSRPRVTPVWPPGLARSIVSFCWAPAIRPESAAWLLPAPEAFQTPLGSVPVDRAAVEASLRFPQVQLDDEANDRDHALEVQLPFLQVVLGSFLIVPFLVGSADPESVDDVVEPLWDGDRTVIVVSSDLSHHHPYEEARRLDDATARAIERLDGASLGPRSACGRNAIAGLLHTAREHSLLCQTVDLRSSGDTAGPRQHVVGYGAWVFFQHTD